MLHEHCEVSHAQLTYQNNTLTEQSTGENACAHGMHHAELQSFSYMAML